jgi:dihydrofolate reductase
MSTVIFSISMSLDGYITGPNQTPEEPLGRDGEFLHEWAFNGGPENEGFLRDSIAEIGAVICGRKTYDDSLPFWGEGGPTGAARLPVFVVSHRPLAASHAGGIYHLAATLPEAVAGATAAAGGKSVSLMGGADLARQAIAAGLVDEIAINIVPVLLGGGTRLFETLDKEVRLERVGLIDTKAATHLRYRVPPRS